jgi:hypothetical protein
MATAKAAAFFYLIISCNLYITNLPTSFSPDNSPVWSNDGT